MNQKIKKNKIEYGYGEITNIPEWIKNSKYDDLYIKYGSNITASITQSTHSDIEVPITDVNTVPDITSISTQITIITNPSDIIKINIKKQMV